MWYRRHDCGLRMAIFFSAATAAGAFGGLLARGIMEMNGVAGKQGWAWIFILEGIATTVVGKLCARVCKNKPLVGMLWAVLIWIAFAAYFVMYDYPSTAKFLSAQEKEAVVSRLREDSSALSDEFNFKFMWDAFKDWKIWVHMFITIGCYTPLYSISIFLPTIVKSIGYTNEVAQLMTVPPYVVACLFTVGSGFLADKQGQRGIYMIFFIGIA